MIIWPEQMTCLQYILDTIIVARREAVSMCILTIKNGTSHLKASLTDFILTCSCQKVCIDGRGIIFI